MKTAISKRTARAFNYGAFNNHGARVARWLKGAFILLNLLAAARLSAATVDTLAGGPIPGNSKPYGYHDGNILTSQFYAPVALALDTDGNLYVADLTNNAVRKLDFTSGQTVTFTTNKISRPVGVFVDGEKNVYVLNRGNGLNGSILKFDRFKTLRGTNAASLTNATAMTADSITNLYVTVRSNTVIRVTPAGVITTVVTITNPGTSLQGITFLPNGLLAATDSRNNGIWLINPTTQTSSKLTGFNGPGDQLGLSDVAQFNRPSGIAGANGNILIVADYNNHRVKKVSMDGIVEHFYGVPQSDWSSGAYQGWREGEACDINSGNCANARQPYAVLVDRNGDVYSTELYYHIIRKTTDTSIPPVPPPPPQVPAPQIGWVSFPFPDFLSFLNVGSSFVFNNDVTIAIKGADGSQVFYTSGPTPEVGTIPDPSPGNGSTPPYYANNLLQNAVTDLGVTRYPDMQIRAIGTKSDGSPSSPIVMARFQFVAGTPTIVGNNAAQFTITNVTANAQMWYTINGTDPDPNTNSQFSVGPITSGTPLSLNATTDFVFKVRAFRPNYQSSSVASVNFSVTNFIPNRISFGVTNATSELHSSFVARPGQFFYAPVTLQLQPGGETMYSLQFNIAVTNGAASPAVQPGAGIDFFSMLMSTVAPGLGDHYPPNSGQWYLTIPPLIVANTNQFGASLFVNTNNNLLGVGWLFRQGYLYEYILTNGLTVLRFDTSTHDLISYSIAHDSLFPKANGLVVAGAYSFQVPTNAVIGDQYFIQLGSPSATRDGIGAPGSDVYIRSPAAPQRIDVGVPTYVVGDAAPFRWLNAGDFGEGNLNNADVMQVFQSAILGDDMPPANSDLFRAMDSAGNFGTNNGSGVFIQSTFYADGLDEDSSLFNLFDGSDTNTIDQMPFGDLQLDVADLFVTFRRSLDPSLIWFKRFWTNGQFVAVTTPNLAFNSNNPSLLAFKSGSEDSPKSLTSGTPPSVSFVAGDKIASAGQTIQIPITAKVLGGYPIRVLGLNVTVSPLDGSPAITQPVQFTAPALGSPTISAPRHAANFSGAWLNAGISGLSGDAVIGNLTITVPGNAAPSSAYAVRFERASASPNGLASFPEKTFKGLVTLSDRSGSTYNDGIPDSWRLRWFGTVNNLLSQADADADGDGTSNLYEYKAGTDPNDVKSVLRASSTDGAGAGECVIRWPTGVNKQYVIEKSASLYGPGWIPVSTNTGTGWEMEYHDTNINGGACFYRVRAVE